MTATECSRPLRERRSSGKIVLTVVVSEQELAEIAHDQCRRLRGFTPKINVSKASEPFATLRVARTSIVPFRAQDLHVINHFRCGDQLANKEEITMGAWIKCTNENGQDIYANLENATTIFRDEGRLGIHGARRHGARETRIALPPNSPQ